MVKIKEGAMKRAVNLRLDESVIYTLNQLSNELHSTKTEIIEKAIELFSIQNNLKQNQLLHFAGQLKNSDAEVMLDSIKESKTSKDFDLDLK